MSPGGQTADRGCDPTKPNVLSSKHFQFVEVTNATPHLPGHDGTGPPPLDEIRRSGHGYWMTQEPAKVEPIKTRVIYAFEVSDGHKPILAAEYLADDQGALRFVPGFKRRRLEVEAAPKGEPVPSAALPLVRRGACLHYACGAIRGRLDVGAIRDMEDRLAPIFRWWDLSVDDAFLHSGGQRYVRVIDPIAIALRLNAAYQEKLDKAIDYVVAHPENPDREEVLVRSLKLELAHKIKGSLLSDSGGNPIDPLDIRRHLTTTGDGTLELDDFIDHQNRKLHELEIERQKAANRVIHCLESSLWADVKRWYLKSPLAANDIGHLLFDGWLRSLDRLGETPQGKAYFADLVAGKDDNVLSYVFHPGQEQGERWERFRRFYPIVHRAATGLVVGFAETAPAIMVHLQRETAKHLVQVTIDFWLGQEITVLAKVGRRGQIARLLEFAEDHDYVRIDHHKAQAELKSWLESGEKAHWPEDSTPATLAKVTTFLLAGVAVVNTINKILQAVDALKKGGEESKEKAMAVAEAVAATLDLVVALEDPVKDLAHMIRAARGAVEHAHLAAAGAEAVAASESEAASFVTRLKGPAAFKFIGAASAAIDMVVYGIEAFDARKKGEIGVAAGDAAIAGGSALMSLASFINAVGIAKGAAALTAASSALLVGGLVIACAGFILVNHFSKTAWQKFAAYCCFGEQGQDGLRAAHRGSEPWSGGDFSEWEPDEEGLWRQLEVFTGLLCGFRIRGDKYDEHTVMVTFGALPPRSKVHFAFTISYATGETRRPDYIVDLDNPKIAIGYGDSETDVETSVSWRGTQVAALQLRVPPGSNSRVKSATCEVVIRYAPHSSDRVATGTIPIGGGFNYALVTDEFVHANDVESTDVEVEEHAAEIPSAPWK